MKPPKCSQGLRGFRRDSTPPADRIPAWPLCEWYPYSLGGPPCAGGVNPDATPHLVELGMGGLPRSNAVSIVEVKSPSSE